MGGNHSRYIPSPHDDSFVSGMYVHMITCWTLRCLWQHTRWCTGAQDKKGDTVLLAETLCSLRQHDSFTQEYRKEKTRQHKQWHTGAQENDRLHNTCGGTQKHKDIGKGCMERNQPQQTEVVIHTFDHQPIQEQRKMQADVACTSA
eukprot:1162034-Pelagomonas_calceolata.AAC.3